MTDMQNLVEKLDRAVGRLEAVSHTSDMHRGYGDSPSKAGAAPYAQAFDSLLACPVAEHLKISKEIGGDMQKDVEMVHTALLVTASQCQQPAGNKLSNLLAPISEQIKEVITFWEKNRGSKLINQLSAVSESIQALGWVAMAPNPGPYVKEMNHAAYKDVDKNICTELQAYINDKTGPVTKELSGLPSGPSAASATPPPPSSLPPPLVSVSSGSDESASLSALFAQVNQRESITFQVMSKVPTISINKTDGCHAYLSKNSLDCEIVSAKSSEMNVLIPTEGGDFNEFPISSTFLLLKLLLCSEKHSYLPSLKYTSG
uniref:CARP motif domain-containing protein n=1 Tax=Nomascus leucogenys TaxID=61853 RepID=A0A2I3HQP6_NOMLE